MDADALLWITIGGLLATGFTSIGSRALRQFSRYELEEICDFWHKPDRFGEILRLHDRVARGVETLANLASTVLVVAVTYWTTLLTTQGKPLFGRIENPWIIFTVVVVGLTLALSAIKLWIPWAIVRVCGASFVFHTWRMWRLTSMIFTPLLWAAHVVDAFFHRVAGKNPSESTGDTFEDEIRSIVTEGHREGLLEEDAREMIEGVIDLRDAHVSEIMTPRTDLHMLSVGMPWEEMLEYVINVGHTRIPVYDKSRDDIIGILYSKDLLPELARGSQETHRPLQEILRPAYFVPETKAVDDLLAEFQKTRTHMAVVLDEYGGVSGLVTIEDVLEEIVGEIIDEYDEELVEEIRVIDPHTAEALGRAHIDEINEEMGLELPEDGDFDTIAGLVFHELGRVPATGEAITFADNVRITVLEATRRRIERVRIEVLREAEREMA
jgi:CBS domain containing-hemolysin-like protein